MNIISQLISKKEVKESKNLYDLKREQKEAAINLKEQKKTLKDSFRAYSKGENVTPWSEEYKKNKTKFEFRHRHIAYCLLRGTELAKIEQPAEDNQPSSKRIMEIMEEYKNEKDVCHCEE